MSVSFPCHYLSLPAPPPLSLSLALSASSCSLIQPCIPCCQSLHQAHFESLTSACKWLAGTFWINLRTDSPPRDAGLSLRLAAGSWQSLMQCNNVGAARPGFCCRRRLPYPVDSKLSLCGTTYKTRLYPYYG